MRSRVHHHWASDLLLLMSLLVLSACAVPKDRHVASDEDEGGIIGTGIIGTITDIGSIYVNGLRITYDANLKVQTAFGKESPEHLVSGDTVKVEAFRESGSYRAMSIERYRPLIGPIEAIADDRSWIKALGVRIRMDARPSIYWKDNVVDWQRLAVGAWIAVDGIWKDKDVIASNVRHVEIRNLASARGVAHKRNDGSLMVGGVRIAGVQDLATPDGSIMAIQGRITKDELGTVLAAENIAIKQFSPAVHHVRVEGFASEASPDRAYTIFGSGLTAYVKDAEDPMEQRRSLFCGTLNDIFDIEQVVPLDAQSKAPDFGDDVAKATKGRPGFGC